MREIITENEKIVQTLKSGRNVHYVGSVLALIKYIYEVAESKNVLCCVYDSQVAMRFQQVAFLDVYPRDYYPKALESRLLVSSLRLRFGGHHHDFWG